MAFCPACNREYEGAESARFCSNCGAPLASAPGCTCRPEGPEGEGKETPGPASKGQGDIAAEDEAPSLGSGGPVLASVPCSGRHDQPPILLEINDNRFYMEGRYGVIDARVLNAASERLRSVAVVTSSVCRGLGLSARTRAASLEAGSTRQHMLQVKLGGAGELVIDIEVRCERAGRQEVYAGQLSLLVLDSAETPQSIGISIGNIDQRVTGEKIMGVSYCPEVKLALDIGAIKSAKDLLSQRFPDRWRRVDLHLDEDLSESARGGAEARVELVTPEGLEGGPLQRAALHFPHAGNPRRVLLLASPCVRMGRHLNDNDIVLRLVPCSEHYADNMSKSMLISRRHLTVEMNADGLFIDDLRDFEHTLVNGKEVRGKGRVQLDGTSVVAMGGVLDLAFTPYLESTTEPLPRAERYGVLGEPDDLWRSAQALRLRSVGIRRLSNLAGQEGYLLIYRWATLGVDPTNEIVLRCACPVRRCARILRLGGRLWLESLTDQACLKANGTPLPRHHVCPLTNGLVVSCEHMRVDVGRFEQIGIE